MRKTFIVATLCLMVVQVDPAICQVRDWENPEIFERNQTQPHATLMPYESVKQALGNKRKSSPWHFTLNGTWKFFWSEVPEKAPKNFYAKGYNTKDWDDIRVPSNWQMEGYGYPKFRNVGHPFPGRPPRVPEKFNPVGSYLRTFTLPANWKDRQVFLHFEGVHSASYVWINGEEVGYNQGGMEPAEYNITGYLLPGENSIAVKVLRFSDGSYLEDQDMWRLSGIFRDVYLIATSGVHVSDFYITTDLDKDYQDATMKVWAQVMNYTKNRLKEYYLRIQLYDATDQAVMDKPLTSKLISDLSNSFATSTQVALITKPKKWSAEYPNLYTLTFELMDTDGHVTEIMSSRVGFREVEVKNQAIYINGIPIKFNGVNSHMQHPETGHMVDLETMRKDLTLMKQFNINCVRTCHYPPNVEYIELADELGMYIVDETGDEAHGYEYISYLHEWRAQYLDRMRKLVYRDRNHPSVVIWSAGNESGLGDNICAIMKEGKKIDPSRPAWMYGGNSDSDPKTNPIKCEDIVGPRYLEPFRLKNRFARIPESKDPRPSFMDEYLAATGNSLGGLDEYWEMIYQYPRLTGGAIWDWISPGINQPVITTPDSSPNNIQCALMNKAHLTEGKFGKALSLSGHDDWVEVYRDPALDISGNKLTLSFWVKPEPWNGDAYFITKSKYQYGLVQTNASTLEFYVFTNKKYSVRTSIPDNWEHTWHHVAGIYDGKGLIIYVDGKEQGRTPCKGKILDGPYSVNIGKSSEIIDSHRGYLCHAEIDRVRIFDFPVPIGDLFKDLPDLKSRGSLWLDFEDVQKRGSFYSIGIPGRTYGLVWPDRSVQPELWQLKKSPQPVVIEAVNLEKGEFLINNRHNFKNLKELDVSWSVTADEKINQTGNMNLDIAPMENKIIRVPYSKPVIQPGVHYYLLIQLKLAEKTAWAEKGHEIAWEQFKLPCYNVPEALVKESRFTMVTEETKDRLFVRGKDFTYIFNKRTGNLESASYRNIELIKKGPGFNVWRAPLANELDAWGTGSVSIGQIKPCMGKNLANGWRSIGLDKLVCNLEQFKWDQDKGKNHVKINTIVSISSNNYTTGFNVTYNYSIDASGIISVRVKTVPHGKMTHWLPKAGLQMQLPESFQQMVWYGRGPFETYPDRKTGAKIGIYKSTVEDEYVPYIIPQDHGNRTDVYWVSLTNREGIGLFVSSDNQFNFSAQKYETDNLSRAYYAFQLKESETITLNLDHKVSGVGGTAILVRNKYRVLPEEYEFTFRLRPFTMEEQSPIELGKQLIVL